MVFSCQFFIALSNKIHGVFIIALYNLYKSTLLAFLHRCSVTWICSSPAFASQECQSAKIFLLDTEIQKWENVFFLSQNSCRSAAVLLYMYVCTIDIEIWLWLSMFSQVLYNRFVLRGICLHHLTYSVLCHVTIRQHSLVTSTHCSSMGPASPYLLDLFFHILKSSPITRSISIVVTISIVL